jgi:GNAT superfamily N-acetyltransferase
MVIGLRPADHLSCSGATVATHTLVLSPATSADAPLLTQIIRAGKAHWGFPAAWLNAWKDELAISAEQIAQWHFRKAAHDGKLVGFFALALHDDEWWLEHLWLVPERIGQGFGADLFRCAVAAASELGATRMRIEAEPNAEAFYLHMGALRDGERISTTTVTTRVLPRFVCTIPRPETT